MVKVIPQIFYPAFAAFILSTLSVYADNGVAVYPAVHQTSHDQAFTTKYEFRLVDGLIWFRARGSETLWKKFAGTGLAPKDFNGNPAFLARLSVDGGILYAIDRDNRIYDAKIGDGDAETVEWSAKWGWPMRLYAFPAYLPSNYRDLAGSYLDGEYARTYEDRAGNSHLVKGVMTLYVLNRAGNAIHYNDPWLPPNHFEARFSTPDRGRVEALSIAAAGSTVMIIDQNADIYTRMIDFDTLGGNPGISYSYEQKNFGYSPTGFWAWCRDNLPWVDVRVLPTNDWELQPKIPLKAGAFVSTRLTIFQNGLGNHARAMRVEGTDETGNTGYYRKSVNPADSEWVFVTTHEPIRGEVVKRLLPLPGVHNEKSVEFSFSGPHDRSLAGKATYYDEGASPILGMTPGRVHQSEAQLRGWNLVFDPIILSLIFKEGRASYTFHALLHLNAGIFPFYSNDRNVISGRLVLQKRDEILKTVPPRFSMRVLDLLDETFKRRSDLPVIVKASPDRVRVEVDLLRMPNKSAACFDFPIID